MKNKKKLSSLKVESFVTSMDNANEQTVQGGANQKTIGCLTVVTFGIWTYCCGASATEC